MESKKSFNCVSITFLNNLEKYRKDTSWYNNSIELNGKFGFQKVTSEKVEKIINKINVKKATDGIPAKLVKASKSVIAPQLLNSGKKIRALHNKKIKYSNSCCPKTNF
jgi:hypothetical protein